MYFLGYDIGSSSVKACLLDGNSGKIVASDFFPKQEMNITAHRAGWAEQEPDMWWKYLTEATKSVMSLSGVSPADIGAIGISYQMHGLVMVDKAGKVIRPAIIWCDSRAVSYGEKALTSIGYEKCMGALLNSPGNFTASKLAWVKENEPELFEKIQYLMLPGDYIAFRMTGEPCTTPSGLSEGILWDFKENKPAGFLLDYFGFGHDIIPEVKPTFSKQGCLTADIARELGLAEGIPVTYRAGDQPNNAFSLNVMNPGEVASTAGTSGVVYGVSDKVAYDKASRVNTFAHVSHNKSEPRLGILLCINGTGILNSWTKRNMAPDMGYEDMNVMAAGIPPGSGGLAVLPFGNGAERMLENKTLGAQFNGLHFTMHNRAHVFRAVQEGIVFSFKYGLDIMSGMGITPKVIRAGMANMFLSPVFRETLSTVTGAVIELYDTDGAAGAARGAGIGSGWYKSPSEAFTSLKKLNMVEPCLKNREAVEIAYMWWKDCLMAELNKS